MLKGKQENGAYRYERKFLVDRLDAGQVCAIVKRHPKLFYQPYPPRYVNNLYLDTPDMRNYVDNVSGVRERRKVRVRWYGDLFDDVMSPVVEFKIKDGLVGIKRGYACNGFRMEPGFSEADFRRDLSGPDLPGPVVQALGTLRVVLCNRYFRRYFATRDGRFRVTVDTEMSYYAVRRTNNRFVHKYVDHRNVVVELKYQRAFELDADKVAGAFPFSVSKNSKYVTGVQQVLAVSIS